MKILKVKANETLEFDNMVTMTDESIDITIPTDVTDDGELCTIISVDASEYPDFDNTDDMQTLELLRQLYETIMTLEDTSVFGSAETFINCMDALDTMIEDLDAESMVGSIDVDDDEDESEEEPSLNLITMPGDVYHTAYNSINWKHNADNVKSIEKAMHTFQTMLCEMYAGKTSIDDVEFTAESVLDNMSINTDYEFPMINDMGKREMATVKMFDAFAAYAVIYAHSLMHREKISCFNTINDIVNFTKSFVQEFKNADSDVERKAVIEGMESFLTGFSLIGEYENEVDDEAVNDVMEAANITVEGDDE